MNKIKGLISEADWKTPKKKDGKNYYQVIINGQKYTGFSDYDILKVGNIVELEYEESGNFKNIKNARFAGSTETKQESKTFGYSPEKASSIEKQVCLKSAIELLKDYGIDRSIEQRAKEILEYATIFYKWIKEDNIDKNVPDDNKFKKESDLISKEAELYLLLNKVSDEKKKEIINYISLLKKDNIFNQESIDKTIRRINKTIEIEKKEPQSLKPDDPYLLMTIEDFIKECESKKEEIKSLLSDDKLYYNVLLKYNLKHCNKAKKSDYKNILIELFEIIKKTKEQIGETSGGQIPF